MNIYIHFYIYFIYNTRPSINNFKIVYYRTTKSGDSLFTLLVTYVSLLKNLSANASLLDIKQPIETWLDVSLIINLLWKVSVRFLLILLFRCTITTHSRQLHIHRMHNNPSVKVWGRIHCLLPCTNFIQKKTEKILVFFDYCFDLLPPPSKVVA